MSAQHQTTAGPTEAARLVPASRFTIEELTNAYNQTRVDYLVPMPMNAARLAAYVQTYDVDLERSWVALDGREPLGLAMLGVRPGRTWVTRLGVLPGRRRAGVGEALVRGLLRGSRELGRRTAILEVIKGNTPAHALFQKVGFEETRELLVMRRPPGPVAGELHEGQAAWLEREEALDLLCGHAARLPWTNEIESYLRAGDAQALSVQLAGGERGWLVFRRQKYLLSHFVAHTAAGDPRKVALALGKLLYQRYPQTDTTIENIPLDDPHLAALQELGFLEVFRRIEMECPLREGL